MTYSLKFLIMAAKVLLVFDFDKTITDKNTDLIAIDILPKKEQKRLRKEFYREGDWTNFMNIVFKELSLQNVSVEELQTKIKLMDLNRGMLELFQYIQANKRLYDCIIISDSNAWFIDTILKAYDLQSSFLKIYTNSATIIENKRLLVNPCHAHNHFSCPNNMCKRILLQTFIEDSSANGIHYSRICYFGDGSNDFCPCSSLQKTDFIFPRKGFPLHKKLNEILQDKPEQTVVKASVLPWESGFEILNILPTLNSL